MQYEEFQYYQDQLDHQVYQEMYEKAKQQRMKP